MPARKRAPKKGQGPAGAQVVGTVHSEASLRHALRLRPGEIDLLELRVDHFAEDPERLEAALRHLKFTFILTVRHPAEGGAGALGPARRRELYRRFLPKAGLVDLELRSVPRFGEVLEEAHSLGMPVIISDHHFGRLPSEAVLRRRFAAARQSGAEIVKVAANIETPAHLSRLLWMLPGDGKPVSVMGMGLLGKASRLLFGRAGSVLNYGYLGEPQVSGQWPAPLLKRRLIEMSSED